MKKCYLLVVLSISGLLSISYHKAEAVEIETNQVRIVAQSPTATSGNAIPNPRELASSYAIPNPANWLPQMYAPRQNELKQSSPQDRAAKELKQSLPQDRAAKELKQSSPQDRAAKELKQSLPQDRAAKELKQSLPQDRAAN